MEIIVPHQIKKKEFGAVVPEEARKIFSKLKEKPAIAVGIASPGLPARVTLHKLYATTDRGARRLLFFCRHPEVTIAGTGAILPERWVLLFYRDKSDSIGKNMTPRNPEFAEQLPKKLRAAIDDIANSTATDQKFDIF